MTGDVRIIIINLWRILLNIFVV